jgi:hypothetical protein
VSDPAPKGLDADLWIQERQRHGQHVVVRGIAGDHLVHAGCVDGECEYSGLPIKPTTLERPMYVAEISKDGTITPELRATWEDVIAYELEKKAADA